MLLWTNATFAKQDNKQIRKQIKNQDNSDLSQFFFLFFFFRSKRMGNSKNENISYRMMLLDSRKLSLRSISSAIYPLTTMDMFGSRGAFHVCSNLPKNCTPYIDSPPLPPPEKRVIRAFGSWSQNPAFLICHHSIFYCVTLIGSRSIEMRKTVESTDETTE